MNRLLPAFAANDRLRNVVVAGILALLAGMLTISYVSGYKRSVQQGENLVPVLVAKRDIPAGARASEVAAAVGVEHVTKRTLEPRALADTAALRGLVSTDPIYKGEQLTGRRFAPLGLDGSLRTVRGPMRLFSLTGDPGQLLAGVLQPGDRVDVVAVVKSGDYASRSASRIVLRNLLVVQPSQTASGSQLSGQSQGSVLLALSDRALQDLFFVTRTSDWALARRPKLGAVDTAGGATTAASILRGAE